MNHTLLITALFATLSLVACERSTVVTVPVPVAVPGPAGATGATGETGGQGATGNTGDQGMQGNQGNQGNMGNTGDKGDKGKTGGGDTIIVMPPASAPAN